MILGAHRASADLGSLEPGTHLCALEPDATMLDRVAATFVGQGLAAGDQLLYVASEDQVDDLVRSLEQHLDAAHVLATGQLLTTSFEGAYGTSPPDDLDAVADGFRLAADQAQKRGFPGLRVAARMDDLSGLLGSMDEVVAWERMATDLQRELQVSSVCLYDTHRLEAGEGAALAREHDGLAPDLDIAPIATFLAVDEPWGVQVRGEVDVSNRHLLHRLVLSRAAVAPRLRLDLEGVTFADACTIARLRSIAAALPEGGQLVLARVPTVVRRVLELTGISHPRLTVEP
ncbi:MEDS domain-containing protein [Nocardioides sp. GCM10028917]|jgi:anti-anti-sigma factor|uniref:MEDS domain-containing protein n=1 Tax=Nocardioides sp. GCM10028917 TaxID=3273408 RepID=UPI00360F0701